MAILTLNRPNALNALSLDMIRTISSYLQEWEKDDSIKAIVFQGAGERAFCAGGDIKSFYQAGMSYRRGEASARVPAVFFAEEYALNKQIFHYSKPLIAIMNGITMGGGYGIAGHCKYRIATEKTVFAMPEVGIGLFPDVGSMFHLRKAGVFGYYLAVTGKSVSGSDMVHAGLADNYILSSSLSDLCAKINVSSDMDVELKNLECTTNPDVFSEELEALFSAQNLTDVIGQLKVSKSSLALPLLDVLSRRSPTSMAVVDMYWARAEEMNFDDVIATDFTLIQHFVEVSDMYEGIRAQVIDKDRAPRWTPENLDRINPDVIEGFFKDTGYNLKDVQIFNS